MLPLSFDNVTVTPCIGRGAEKEEFVALFLEVHIFGVYILNYFQTTQNSGFGRMWFGTTANFRPWN